MVPDHDRYTGAQRWRHPGTTGQHKEEFTMMGWYGNAMGSLGWLGMGVFWFLLLGLIGWLVMRLLPGSSGRTSRPTGDSAAEILDRRLARGEIDVPAWQTQRSALQGTQDSRK
jgi:putative membrane protein